MGPTLRVGPILTLLNIYFLANLAHELLQGACAEGQGQS